MISEVAELDERGFAEALDDLAAIPGYAELPDGTLASTTIYFKVLR